MDTGLARRANILFLKGVYLADLGNRDEIFDRKFASIDERSTIRVIYQPLPERFTALENWPKCTNLKCWECDCSFSTVPIPIATDMYALGADIAFDTHGNFCTFSCAQKYINTKFKNEPSKHDKDKFLKILCFIFTGKKTDFIVPSPDKTKMQQYCGEGGLTYQAFRDEIYRLNSDYDLSMYKLSQFAA